jgi:hypothetical protein
MTFNYSSCQKCGNEFFPNANLYFKAYICLNDDESEFDFKKGITCNQCFNKMRVHDELGIYLSSYHIYQPNLSFSGYMIHRIKNKNLFVLELENMIKNINTKDNILLENECIEIGKY